MSTSEPLAIASETRPARRHDLDALRAFAMLLGIVLHGAMSFIPRFGDFWGIQDSQSNPLYEVLVASIHGWRMPLFFLISGFFTTMLWKKSGGRALLVHRFKRIFLPLSLAMVTIIPLLLVVSGYIRAEREKASTESSINTQPAGNDKLNPADVNVSAAVVKGDLDTLNAYLQNGGDVDAKDAFGSAPMHVACLFGRARVGELLLNADASLEVTNNDGLIPERLLALDWETTAFVAQLVQVPIDKEEVLAGREQIAQAIFDKTGRSVATKSETEDSTQNGGAGRLMLLLFYMPFFFHLWFLWFLCWLVCGFVLLVSLLQAMKFSAVPKKWLVSSARYLWLIPLSAVPQYFMGRTGHGFGPDTSIGLLPIPAVFAYYAIFFAYGAMYFGADDQDAVVGRGYWWKLAAAILILLPIGLNLQQTDIVSQRILSALVQVSYAWVMSFGMIGLFNRVCGSQRSWIRYLSDSSYWLYLAHIPLIMLVQFLVRSWSLPSVLKFVMVCSGTTAVLLLSYQFCVRKTWLGVLLNGRRYPRQNGEAQKPDAKTPLVAE